MNMYSNMTGLFTLVQVAEQQGKYLAKCLNDEARGHDGPHKPFVYHHLGSMASLGAHCGPTNDCARSHGLLVAIQRAHALAEFSCRRPISGH